MSTSRPPAKGIIGATWEGLKGRLAASPAAAESYPSLAGCDCLVTGANSGLGKGIATQLATLGARMLMAVRTMDEAARDEIASASGNDQVELAHLDLACFDSVRAFVANQAKGGRQFSIVVCNAGVVAVGRQVTTDGLDQMCQVNFLSNVLLVESLLASGCLRAQGPLQTPRLVFISSEAHRWSQAIALEMLGRPAYIGVSQVMAHYARTKFLLTAYTAELARRLADSHADPQARAAVFTLCPGAVNSNIARQAPAFLKPVLKGMFGLFFASPRQAAWPAVHLACAPSLEGRSGIYFHLMNEKPIDERAADPVFGRQLRQRALEIVA